MSASPKPLRLAVLIGGSGRTLVNLAQHIAQGQLSARIDTVIAAHPQLTGIQRAAELQLPCQVMPALPGQSSQSYAAAVWSRIQQQPIDMVVLAGWLRLLPMVEGYEHRVINIHPALLPAFGGRGMWGHHVHQAVLRSGCKVSGCTVHLCDHHYDTGPIVVQRTCPVLEDDTPNTLAARVFAQECLAYPQALQLFAENRVQITGRIARIIPV